MNLVAAESRCRAFASPSKVPIHAGFMSQTRLLAIWILWLTTDHNATGAYAYKSLRTAVINDANNTHKLMIISRIDNTMSDSAMVTPNIITGVLPHVVSTRNNHGNHSSIANQAGKPRSKLHVPGKNPRSVPISCHDRSISTPAVSTIDSCASMFITFLLRDISPINDTIINKVTHKRTWIHSVQGSSSRAN